jgi:hypothetical protein
MSDAASPAITGAYGAVNVSPTPIALSLELGTASIGDAA